jgi:hypothetical protein
MAARCILYTYRTLSLGNQKFVDRYTPHLQFRAYIYSKKLPLTLTSVIYINAIHLHGSHDLYITYNSMYQAKWVNADVHVPCMRVSKCMPVLQFLYPLFLQVFPAQRSSLLVCNHQQLRLSLCLFPEPLFPHFGTCLLMPIRMAVTLARYLAQWRLILSTVGAKMLGFAPRFA